MTQYINKSALVAEIERRTDELWELIPDGEKVFSNKHTKEDTFNLGKYTALESLDKFIDTLEVKQVDLDYIKKELDKLIKIHKPDGDFGWGTLYNVATHFFELGMRVNNPITSADRGTAEEIIINLKRVEQDYRIDLTREIEWLRNKVKKRE